jgi:hypothetical protein
MRHLFDQPDILEQRRAAPTGAGVKTVGEIREASDATLLSFQDLGASSIARLRETLGPAQPDALKPKRKKPG